MSFLDFDEEKQINISTASPQERESVSRLRVLEDKLDRIEQNLSVLMSVIIVSQKSAAVAAGITPETIRNKTLRDQAEVLGREDSTLNFVTLKQVAGLRRRKKPRRKRLSR